MAPYTSDWDSVNHIEETVLDSDGGIGDWKTPVEADADYIACGGQVKYDGT